MNLTERFRNDDNSRIIFQKIVSHGAKLEINLKNELNRDFETMIIRGLFFKKLSLMEQNLKSISKTILTEVSKR